MSNTEILTQRYANLSQAKRILLEKRLKTKNTKVTSGGSQVIVRLAERDALPLSLGQQRIWFMDQLDPGNPVYNEFVAMRLQGQLQVELLERSLNEIARRHETLRTSIREVEGKPIQVILPFQAFTLKQVDLRNYDPKEREQLVEQLGVREARTAFILAQGPWWRVTLLLLSEQEHVLLLTIHHIICDGWSSALLVKELCTHYQCYRDGQDTSLHDLPIQYADYAAWQRRSLQEGEVAEHQLVYWKKQLAGMPALLELPTDRLRPAVQTFNGFTYPFEFPAQLFKELKALALREGVTLYMLLLAVFQLLLYRYTGQEDIVVGSPIAGRNVKETEELIGFFVNSLVLRTDFSGNPRFLDLLQRVRTLALEAYAHQDIPFEMLVDVLQPDRKLSHNPLIQVMFALYNGARPTLEFTIPQLTITQMDEIERGTAKFDFSIFMWETKESIGGLLEASTELFTLPTLQRMIRNYQTLLESIVAAPETPIADLPLLNAAEQQEMLRDWNDTSVPLPTTFKSVALLVEEQVERSGGRLAVVSSTEKLTYDELNRRANQLAIYLRSLGVGPEQHIALCVERSVDLLIGALAILKTGAAYLPLDPAYPHERLAFMLNDAAVPVLLAQRQIAASLPEMHLTRVVWMDDQHRVFAQQEEHNLVQQVSAENLAYVIYTSGSTGTPKGVQITQRGLLNLIYWHREHYTITSNVRATQLASIGFDAAVWEIWPYLTSGACLYLPDAHIRQDPQHLQNWLCEHEITHCFLPTPLAESILALPWPHACTLRALLTGGDRLHRPSQPLPEFTLFNHYGPTEYSVVTTVGQVHYDEENNPPSIGRPISNTSLYILDIYMQPMPVGVPGQLYIGGAGLARGYLHRPELTAERFVPDPFCDRDGARLYQTGDMGCYLPTGEVKFIGRRDHQVKVRGFRIELGEIEAVMRLDQHVQDAVVLVREGESGYKQLIAYVVPKLDCELVMEQLRATLQQKLPAYMLPSVFMTLPALPLTANGKIDQKALPAPAFTYAFAEEADAHLQQSPVEQTLTRVWAQVLGLPHIGVHDNFFELGGDSIISIQVVAKARQAGIYLTPKQLFQRQTIAELASVIETTPGWEAEQETVTGNVALTPIQLWFFEQDLPDPHHWNQAFLLEMRCSVQANYLQTALEQVVKHHDALRLRFSHDKAGWKQYIVAAQEENTFSLFDLSAFSPTEQSSALTQEATRLQESLDLQKGPLLRASLFYLNKEHFRFLLVIHHLAIDGVSWRILLEDLQMAYQQLEQGKEVQFAEKTTSFKQWSWQLQEYARSQEVCQEAKIWLSRQSGVENTLPVDTVLGENSVASISSVIVMLPIEETQILLHELVRIYHATLFEIVLAALVLVLRRWVASPSLLIDLEGHGREEVLEGSDLSRTIGWFTSMYPFHLQLSSGNDLDAALVAVKEQLLTLPHKGLGYGLLRYLSIDPEIKAAFANPARALISFNYLGQFDQIFSGQQFWSIAHENIGSSHSVRGQRCHLLNVEMSIINKQLHIMWLYSENIHRRTTIERLAQSYLETIREFIAWQRVPTAGQYRPSDFPDEDISQDDLAAILQQMSSREEM